MVTTSNTLGDVLFDTSTIFPGLSSIRMYSGTIQHIEDKHPEVLANAGIEGVIETVSKPTKVFMGNVPDSLVFVNSNVTYGRAVLNVPVHLEGNDSAKVRTAIFMRKEQSSLLVWSPNDAS